MSQAYQDVEKMDIIDKLANIGNNYAITTSGLSESLQKSAATLSVAGDSLDEAIALTAAGLYQPERFGNISLRTHLIALVA